MPLPLGSRREPGPMARLCGLCEEKRKARGRICRPLWKKAGGKALYSSPKDGSLLLSRYTRKAERGGPGSRLLF